MKTTNWNTTNVIESWHGLSIAYNTVVAINLSRNQLQGNTDEHDGAVTRPSHQHLFIYGIVLLCVEIYLFTLNFEGKLPTGVRHFVRLHELCLADNGLTGV